MTEGQGYVVLSLLALIAGAVLGMAWNVSHICAAVCR
jgi:hypothetical protein